MPRDAAHLHAATVEDALKAAQSAKPLTLEEAAERGDRMAELQAMRMVIARALPGCNGRDMAALSRRQIEIGREIEAMKQAAEEEADDASATPDEPWDAARI